MGTGTSGTLPFSRVPSDRKVVRATEGDGGREEVEASGDGDQDSGEYSIFVAEKCTLFMAVRGRNESG